MALIHYLSSWVDAVRPVKANIRNGYRDYVVHGMTAAELRTTDTQSARYVIVAGSAYALDAADTATVDDGASCIVSSNAQRYKLVTVMPPQFNARLDYASTTAVRLFPAEGGQLFVAGLNRQVPAAGVTGSNAGTAANTTYYVYAAYVSAAVTLELSTTVPVTDATYGHQVKTGDATRTLVGMARTDNSALFADSVTKRFVLTYYKRRARSVGNALPSAASVTAAPYAEIATTARSEFLSWGELLQVNTFGLVDGGTAGMYAYLGVALGTVLGTLGTSWARFYARCMTPGYPVNLSSSEVATANVGYNVATISGGVSGGTGSYGATYTGYGFVIQG